jgi:hypothetical protein
VKTDELIVELVRNVRPVQPLASPWLRFARWTMAVVPLAALGAVVIGLRADVLTMAHQRTFMGLAAVTGFTALLSAAGAFVLSVPGAERSPAIRVAPIVTAAVWLGGLLVLVSAGGHPVQRIVALPIHVACILEIAGFGVAAGWPLLAMLRRAAPLRPVWSAALATLAAGSIGAVATQFV